MNYRQKYFELCNGPYGLVDIAHRGIWLSLDNEKVAHQIKKTFNSKLTLAVVDLSTFVNYTENLIDSEVCLDWTLPYTTKLLLSTHSLNQNAFNTTHNDYNLVDPLVNQPPNILLSRDQQLELQDQIFLYKQFVQRKTSITVNKFCTQEDIDLFFKKLDMIVMTELTLVDIEQQVYELCCDYLETLPTLASSYLRILGRLYE